MSQYKTDIIQQYKRNEKDTGSPEVQIALLTHNILSLDEHMKAHPKDYHSRRGLLKQVSLRRRLLKYLNKVSVSRYNAILAALNLRR